MGLALAYKRGNNNDVSQNIKDIADSMSEKELEDYASTNDSELENEAMSIATRKKMSRLAKKNAKKAQRKKKILQRKKKNSKQLMTTAIKKAKGILVKKMMNKSDSEMSMQDKITISKKLMKKKGAIKKLAKKLLPKIKSAENERIAKIRQSKL